jgi:fatty acid desaturase
VIDERRNATALGFVGLWALGAGLLVYAPGTLPIRVLGTLLIALAIVAMQVVMHEAVHGLLARGRGLNRWAGVAFGAPGLLGMTAYRIVHTRHHRQSLIVSAEESLLYGTPASIVVVPWIAWRHAGRQGRLHIVQEYVAMALAFVVVFAATPRDVLARLWFWPFVAALAISSVRGWTEFAAERLVRRWPALARRPSLQTLSRLVTDHLEHHLCPGLPWHRLPALRAVLREEYRQRGGASYLEFLWAKVESHEPPAAWRRSAGAAS